MDLICNRWLEITILNLLLYLPGEDELSTITNSQNFHTLNNNNSNMQENINRS